MRLYDYAASGNCYKVRLLLAQLEIACERVPIDIFGGDTLTDDFAMKNPLRETPVLELDSGRFVSQSNAILLYLAEGTPLLPVDREERAEAHRWLFLEQADVIPAIAGLRFRLQTGRLAPDSEAALARRSAAERLLGVIDAHLRDRAFLVDGYTVADISLYGYVHAADEAGLDMERYPALQAWLARVEDQPRFMNDLEPYPANARAGAGRSIYG